MVLAVLDTVRADHLSCYGYPRRTTPAIDALAERGDRYAEARSTSSWTLPSHASMLTGRFPFHHGAQARKDPASGQVIDALPLREVAPDGSPMPTLAEVLGGEGYQCFAVVANGGYLGVRFGLDRGFDEYSEKPPDGRPRRAREVNRLALGMLEGRDPARPFFLFLNYMDAHRPYNVAALPAEREAELPAADPADTIELLNELVVTVLETDEAVDPALVERILTHYDRGIAHGDLAIEGLVSWLEAAGEWDRTLFIVTSDHGEFFGEHDLAEHSKDIYEPGVRVPLVVRNPGQRSGRVIDEPVSVVQIPCLVVEALPDEARARLAGTFACMPSDGTSYTEIRYTRGKDLRADYGHRFDRERTALYLPPWKLIMSSDGRHELYDLTQDPGEATNLFAEGDERSSALLQHVRGVRARADRGDLSLEPPERSAAELEELRKLGYLDGVEDR